MASARTIASRFHRMFIGVKRVELAHVAAERSTRTQAMKILRRHYEKFLEEYLRIPGTTYEAWIDIVRPEWVELEEASFDDAVWDRLVETFERRIAC